MPASQQAEFLHPCNATLFKASQFHSGLIKEFSWAILPKDSEGPLGFQIN